MRKFTFYLTIIWATIIFILSVLPGDDLPSFSFWDLIGLDKIGHWLFYGILCFLIIETFFLKYPHSRLGFLNFYGIILSISYGIAMEFFQGYFCKTRSAEFKDIIADSIGIFLAAILHKNGRKLYLFLCSKIHWSLKN